jgi:uncharacterized membrane protein YfcA
MVVLLGLILGFCFGLTGTGGSTLAVPLLVYGIGLAPHRAVCTSMITIGTMAALRSIQNLRNRRVDFRTSSIVTAAGLAGAPAGAWFGRMLPEKWLLVIFASIVLVVALRLLLLGPSKPRQQPRPDQTLENLQHTELCSCVSAVAPVNFFTLCLTGLTTGVLAGLLGVGGGFVVVPALVLFCELDIHRAISTSMFSLALISLAAMTAHWFAGQRPPLDIVALFTVGALLGLAPGVLLAKWLSGPRLQRVFALILLVLAAFIIIRSSGAF